VALREGIISTLNSRGGKTELLLPSDAKPAVILVVGVNGGGKTTTIGKLAHQFTREGMRVMLGSGDTFRAAAFEQLKTWGERTGAAMGSYAEGKKPAQVWNGLGLDMRLHCSGVDRLGVRPAFALLRPRLEL
jgi:fused signal recognition particle receptor